MAVEEGDDEIVFTLRHKVRGAMCFSLDLPSLLLYVLRWALVCFTHLLALRLGVIRAQARCVAAVEGDSARDTFLVGTVAPKGVRDNTENRSLPCNDVHLLELKHDAVSLCVPFEVLRGLGKSP